MANQEILIVWDITKSEKVTNKERVHTLLMSINVFMAIPKNKRFLANSKISL